MELTGLAVLVRSGQHGGEVAGSVSVLCVWRVAPTRKVLYHRPSEMKDLAAEMVAANCKRCERDLSSLSKAARSHVTRSGRVPRSAIDAELQAFDDKDLRLRSVAPNVRYRNNVATVAPQISGGCQTAAHTGQAAHLRFRRHTRDDAPLLPRP